MQDSSNQTPTVEIDRSADATPREGHQAPPVLNSFQLKQHNEQIIARLMQTGLFQSKQHLLQAALMTLFAEMQKAFQAADARASAPKPTTEQIAEKVPAGAPPVDGRPGGSGGSREGSRRA
jgi:Arc/MetJ-type ribon-helix-helix transcriptional regulator